MHEQAFADAARPTRCVVLNISLTDYTIGHELLLWKDKNPFVTYGPDSFHELPAEEQNEALVRAVYVCSQSWSENHFTPQTFVDRWKFRRSFRRWRRSFKKVEWTVEMALFRGWLTASNSEFPTRKIPRPDSKEPYHLHGAPEMARLINYVSQFHAQLIAAHYRTAFDFPLAFARMLYLTEAETDGAVWVQNYYDWQQDERAKAYAAAHPESTLAVGPEQVQAAAEKWNREHPECPVPLERPPNQTN